MTSDPLVSVVVPMFGAERTVAAAVESALGQTLREIEVIAIDDASPDGSADAAVRAAAGDRRFRLIRLARNGGVSVARNAGIAAARGTWIGLLDADDRYLPERLALLLADRRASSADLMADDMLVRELATGAPPTHAFPAEQMAARGRVDAVAFVAADRPEWGPRAAGFMKPIMRRAFLARAELAYVPGLDGSEDFHLYVTALLRGGRLYYAPHATYAYAMAEASLSRSDPDRVRRAIAGASDLLRVEASERGATDVVQALDRRMNDFTNWLAYRRIVDAVRARRPLEAIRSCMAHPSPGSVVRRLVDGARRRLPRSAPS